MGQNKIWLHLKNTSSPIKKKKKKKEHFWVLINIVGVLGLGAHIYVYIGPRAQSEDVK